MQYHIEGMDCASCVGKIETALARMPDVSDIQLNFATEKLTLTLAPDGATQFVDVEKTIKRLGFGISATTDESIGANGNLYHVKVGQPKPINVSYITSLYL